MLFGPPVRRRPRRRGFPHTVALVFALLAVFVLGIAVGQALDDSPKGGVVTSVRTLTPLPQQPPTRTVTVTVTEP
jgi:hypothetical protein